MYLCLSFYLHLYLYLYLYLHLSLYLYKCIWARCECCTAPKNNGIDELGSCPMDGLQIILCKLVTSIVNTGQYMIITMTSIILIMAIIMTIIIMMVILFMVSRLFSADLWHQMSILVNTGHHTKIERHNSYVIRKQGCICICIWVTPNVF